jgi:hypothetical protein
MRDYYEGYFEKTENLLTNKKMCIKIRMTGSGRKKDQEVSE